MNQFFAAGLVTVITLMLWGLGKKPKTLMKEGLSRELPINEPSLVQQLDPIIEPINQVKPIGTQFKRPFTSRQKLELRRHLKKLISSHPDERLIAVDIASEWGDSSVIPVLKIGLRDMDSRVVIRAAKGINQFRNQPIISKTQESISHPLNVFLMR